MGDQRLFWIDQIIKGNIFHYFYYIIAAKLNKRRTGCKNGIMSVLAPYIRMFLSLCLYLNIPSLFFKKIIFLYTSFCTSMNL
jgi:hypothetical protein